MSDPDTTPTFSLPSGPHLIDLTMFYDKATFNKDGSATVIFKLPPEQKPNILALSNNDGMALNARVWTTQLPSGMQRLAEAVGMSLPVEHTPLPRKLQAKA